MNYQQLLRRVISAINEQRINLNSIMKRGVFVYPERYIDQHQQRTDELSLRLKKGTIQSLNRAREVSRNIRRNILYLAPRARIDKTRETLIGLKREIKNMILHRLEIKKNNLAGIMENLDMLSPLSVLKRGYSICRKYPGMELVKEASSVSKGSRVNVKVFKGEMVCDVSEIKEGRS
jgi:exodeoxyribonuclease VII large subunit